MPFKRLLIEPQSDPIKLRLGVEGDPLPSHPFFTIHLCHLGVVREEPIWWTALNPDQLGAPLPNAVEGIRYSEIYCVYVGAEELYQLRSSPHAASTIFIQHFLLTENGVTLVSEDAAAEKRKEMADNISVPMYARDGHDPTAKAFQIVVFYAGVSIHNSSSTKGISLTPVNPGLSNISVFHAVSDYLLEHHSVVKPTDVALRSYLLHQPLFAVTFHQVFSVTAEGALTLVEQIAKDISTIIASEQGDKPFPVLSFTLDCNSQNYNISPTNFDFRGNLLPPLFASTHTNRIETLLPIIQAKPFARLILELYVQALAERDRSFRVLRQWSLLEMIADRQVQSKPNPLTNLDGSPITFSSGKPLDTSRKEGKVYSYLRDGDLSPIYQQSDNGSMSILEGSKGPTNFGNPPQKVVRLWDAVAAAYRMRNDVAHDGIFTPYQTPRDDRELLCNELFEGRYGFLEHALSSAVWREISRSM